MAANHSTPEAAASSSADSKAKSFLDYPEAQEYTHKSHLKAIENNPVVNGLPLHILANIIARVGPLQSFFWHNAGFSTLAKLPELDHIPVRFHPTVISLGPVEPSFVPFEKPLLQVSSRPIASRFYSISDYHAAYLSGEVTPLQVVDTLLPLIAQNQSPPGVYESGWVHAHDSVRPVLEAARASTERYAQGKPLGVLDGVPIGVKDDTDVEGWVNHWGMNPNMPNNPNYKPSEKSSWPVLKLQEAGAIVIGKNRMHELGSETSGNNPSQGTPLNHYNNSYFPGGSSSGCGSCVSAGVVPFAVGTDAGGSIRIPAAYNGIYGLQPTHQRVVAMTSTMVRTGPLAANVADLTIAYRLMSQPDPNCSIRKLYSPSQPLGPGARRTIGICSELWEGADPRVASVCRAAVDYLASRKGYEVVDITLPLIQEGRLSHGLLALAEIVREERNYAPNRSGHWLSHLNNLSKLLLSVASQSTTQDYMAASSMRELQMRNLAHLFAAHPNLLIVTPTAPVIGWPKPANADAYGASDTNLSIRNMMYVWLSNLTGTPAVTAPVGYVDPDQGKGKMPIGLMASGEWGSEEQLLTWAGDLEEYLHDHYEGGRRKPETWLDVLNETKRQAGK